MKKLSAQRYLWLAFTALTFFVLLAYSYARFFIIPYVGFRTSVLSGQVSGVYIEKPERDGLQADDLLLGVNGQPWDEYTADRSWLLFKEFMPGDYIQLDVQRGNQIFTLDWDVLPPSCR